MTTDTIPGIIAPSGPNAIDFVPDGIAAKELYQFLGPMIDYAMTPSPVVPLVPVDPLVRPLLLDFQDGEAVNAYLNLAIRPVLGTRKAMDYAFNLLQINPALQEWYQQDPIEKAFRFEVVFTDETLPRGAFDFEALITMLFALKNERSWLLSIRMDDCADMMTLDNDCILDLYYLDSLEGYVDPVTGIIICLHEGFTQFVDAEEQVGAYLRTSDRVEQAFPYANLALDFITLGEDAFCDEGTFFHDSARTSQRAFNVIRLPRFFNTITRTLDPSKYQGRTSDRVQNTQELVNPTPYHLHTGDRAFNVIDSVTPVIAQPVPSRNVTAVVPLSTVYPSLSWDDFPDGQSMTWADTSMLSWGGSQPIAFSHHSVGDSTTDLRMTNAIIYGFYNFQASGVGILPGSQSIPPNLLVEPLAPGLIAAAPNGTGVFSTTIQTFGYPQAQWALFSGDGTMIGSWNTLVGSNLGVSLDITFTASGQYIAVQTLDQVLFVQTSAVTLLAT